MNKSSASVLFLMAATLVPAPLLGQFEMMIFQAKVPQAHSRQELDSFLDLVQASEPEEALVLVTRFRDQFRHSEFIAQTYRIEMNAQRELEHYQRAIRAGEHALKLNPDDLETLLTLANMFPRGADNSEATNAVLSTAESYAQRALDGIASLRAARSISLENWQRQTGQMKATAHSALGVIALKRGRHSASIAEFETCISQNPVADGAQYYMLGLAYWLNGNTAQATTALKRASELGPHLVRVRAENELAALEKNR